MCDCKTRPPLLAKGFVADWLLKGLPAVGTEGIVQAVRFEGASSSEGIGRGIRIERIRAHSANVPLLYVSQQLGHSKPTITLKYYARWIASGQVHRVNVLEGTP